MAAAERNIDISVKDRDEMEGYVEREIIKEVRLSLKNKEEDPDKSSLAFRLKKDGAIQIELVHHDPYSHSKWMSADSIELPDIETLEKLVEAINSGIIMPSRAQNKK